MDWFEVISENFIVAGGRPLENLARFAGRYRVVPTACRSRSAPSSRSIDDYLDALCGRSSIASTRRGSPIISAGVARPGLHLHDLLPLPYTREAVEHVVERVKRVQGRLERPFALENVSSYMTLSRELDDRVGLPRRDRGARRLRAPPRLQQRLRVGAKPRLRRRASTSTRMPADRVVQMHLAGHTDKGTLPPRHPLRSRVRRGVVALSSRHRALRRGLDAHRVGRRRSPTWEVLAAEAERARVVRAEVPRQ